MWHLKDWVLNDPEFGAKDKEALKRDIHAEECLLVCSDIANGSKHLRLDSPKAGSSLSDRRGLHVEPSLGVCKELYFVSCLDKTNKYHGVEIRDLLGECRNTWERILNKHHLSVVDISCSP
jgi:hypothetical protein